MNAMIRGLKGTLALLALAGLGLGLRWMTAGSVGAANSNDLDSMAALAVSTVAWMAYSWLVLGGWKPAPPSNSLVRRTPRTGAPQSRPPRS